MDFSISEEQSLIVESARRFVEEELFPHEKEVEETDAVSPDLVKLITAKI